MKKRILATVLVVGVVTATVPAVGISAVDEGGTELTLQAVDTSEVTNDGAVYADETVEQSGVSSRAIPQGSYGINLNVNGRQVLQGRVFALGGITYVPMFAFADWLGNFTYSYSANTATARVEGENLEITAHAGDLYIKANDRYFYTGREVVLFGNEIYVPILPMTKALNSRIQWRDDMGGFYVSSGDTRLLKSASRIYRDDEVYWLARIISAEARGESMEGKIAVGNVVLNRVRSPLFPNTIYGVIFDKKYGVQFSPTANGSIYNTPTEESIIAAKICLEGYTLSSGALYFVNPTKSPNSWIANNRTYAFTIGNHAFFE